MLDSRQFCLAALGPGLAHRRHSFAASEPFWNRDSFVSQLSASAWCTDTTPSRHQTVVRRLVPFSEAEHSFPSHLALAPQPYPPRTPEPFPRDEPQSSDFFTRRGPDGRHARGCGSHGHRRRTCPRHPVTPAARRRGSAPAHLAIACAGLRLPALPGRSSSTARDAHPNLYDYSQPRRRGPPVPDRAHQQAQALLVRTAADPGGPRRRHRPQKKKTIGAPLCPDARAYGDAAAERETPNGPTARGRRGSLWPHAEEPLSQLRHPDKRALHAAAAHDARCSLPRRQGERIVGDPDLHAARLGALLLCGETAPHPAETLRRAEGRQGQRIVRQPLQLLALRGSHHGRPDPGVSRTPGGGIRGLTHDRPRPPAVAPYCQLRLQRGLHRGHPVATPLGRASPRHGRAPPRPPQDELGALVHLVESGLEGLQHLRQTRGSACPPGSATRTSRTYTRW